MAKEKHIWRWTGFHYGMDLLMITDGATISIKRNHRPEFEQLLSLQTIRHIAIRLVGVLFIFFLLNCFVLGLPWLR